MDDIKETVRQAGLNLSRTVRGLTLRYGWSHEKACGAACLHRNPMSGPGVCACVHPGVFACRLADPEFTRASQGREAISATLPLLLDKGAGKGCASGCFGRPIEPKAPLWRQDSVWLLEGPAPRTLLHCREP